MLRHIIWGSLFKDTTEKTRDSSPHTGNTDTLPWILVNYGSSQFGSEIYWEEIVGGGEHNKAAKSTETAAFDCPSVRPEILEGLQDVSEEQHSADSPDAGGLREKLEYV